MFSPFSADKLIVERRKESRLKANQSVTVTALGLLAAPPMSGAVIDMSGSGLQVRLPHPVPLGSPVKVEALHMVMVGEVSRCDEQAQEEEPGYVAALTLSHITSADEKP